MRIITKQSDYYDSIQSYGQDQSVIYIRKPEELFDENFVDEYYNLGKSRWGDVPVSHLYNVSDYRGVDIVKGFSVFFCGQRYNAVVTSVPNPDRDVLTRIRMTHYNLDELDKYIDGLKLKEKREYLPKYRRRYGAKKESTKTLERLTNFFNMSKTNDNIHFDLDVPVFVIDAIRDNSVRHIKWQKGIVKNPILKDYGFAHIKDPYTAYQEIDMYISGVMGGKSPRMQEISDDVMKQQKGFDKWSFKTMPTKKR